MRSSTLIAPGVILALSAAPSLAQSNPLHQQIGHVADGSAVTPFMQGFLPTALAEATVAAQHVELANEAAFSLADVQLHVGHVLHALDPALASGGPGLGYGARLAAATAASYLEPLVSDSTASENARLHVGHILTILTNVVSRADQAVSIAQQIQSASSASAATGLLGQLTLHVETLAGGRDLDRDERIGWQGGEGGLRQATQHMTLLKRGEGLIP
jgi:hypothetical protein